ncbi:unnamed protein product [Brachionus calyciflorus]|uniref:Troponin I n=1 Tax=Brachionus calyciflorus TaxID=104777 RepID=A0A814A3I2_9BILA|nr:unnamed protein product [Brachionus calyciflorus]
MNQELVLTEEERKQRKKEERARKREEARKNAEKKRRFGLTPEKKRKLRILIMKEATNALGIKAREKEEAKKNYIAQNVKELPDLTSLNEAQLVSICKDFHRLIVDNQEVKYDLEKNIIKQDYEINELTIKVNDIKGKFIKPTLKKVKKIQNILTKIDKPENPGAGFGVSLKSTGIDKFALETKEEEEKF